MAERINIIARQNGVGLDRDVRLIHDVLVDGGYEVTVSHCRGIPPLRAIFPGKKSYTANLFIERIYPRWLGQADVNFVVPNQERFPKRHLSLLRRMDHVLCKTDHGFEVFSNHHESVHQIGFTSPDMRIADLKREDPPACLHLAGRSTLKGTETVLSIWEKHPEWPNLTLIQCPENAPHTVPDNVTLLTEYLSDEELQTKLNENLIHLCPSLSEGWGHYIVEAMSCSAIVVTTDGPPMNELVNAERGFVVPFQKQEPRHLGTNFFVDPDALEETLTKLFSSPSDELKNKGARARSWFEENDRAFATKLSGAMKKLLGT